MKNDIIQVHLHRKCMFQKLVQVTLCNYGVCITSWIYKKNASINWWL